MLIQGQPDVLNPPNTPSLGYGAGRTATWWGATDDNWKAQVNTWLHTNPRPMTAERLARLMEKHQFDEQDIQEAREYAAKSDKSEGYYWAVSPGGIGSVAHYSNVMAFLKTNPTPEQRAEKMAAQEWNENDFIAAQIIFDGYNEIANQRAAEAKAAADAALAATNAAEAKRLADIAQIAAAQSAEASTQLKTSDNKLVIDADTVINAINAIDQSNNVLTETNTAPIQEMVKAVEKFEKDIATTNVVQDNFLDLNLPTNWSTYSPQQKIAWFNANSITPLMLLGAGVSQDDIDWMKANGYSVEDYAFIEILAPDLVTPLPPRAPDKSGTLIPEVFEELPLMLDLPTNWSTYTPQQKIAYFNANSITESMLLAAGVSQDDINWMKSNGYTGKPAASIKLTETKTPTNAALPLIIAAAAAYFIGA